MWELEHLTRSLVSSNQPEILLGDFCVAIPYHNSSRKIVESWKTYFLSNSDPPTLNESLVLSCCFGLTSLLTSALGI